MRHTFIIAKRVLRQLKGDPRLLALSIVAPFAIVYLLKIYFDSLAPAAPSNGAGVIVQRFAVPIAAFLVHFLSFLLCSIVLVRERSQGTLERMFINGFTRTEVIGGYLIGYLGLATLQAVVALGEVVWLFELSYSFEVLATLFVVIWLLAIASVTLGIFISTFTRNEGQVFPFIPLITLPSVFLSGLLIDVALLPRWAQVVGHFFPLFYANKVIQEVIQPSGSLANEWLSLASLVGYIFVLLFAASRTLSEVEG
jgi:ABC-2 type transport system permease protein